MIRIRQWCAQGVWHKRWLYRATLVGAGTVVAAGMCGVGAATAVGIGYGGAMAVCKAGFGPAIESRLEKIQGPKWSLAAATVFGAWGCSNAASGIAILRDKTCLNNRCMYSSHKGLGIVALTSVPFLFSLAYDNYKQYAKK